MEPLLSGSPQPGLPTLCEQVSLSHREDMRPGSAHTDPSLLFTFGLEGLGGKSQCQASIWSHQGLWLWGVQSPIVAKQAS